MPHGGDQNDHDGEVDLSSEEAHRGRCHSLAAAVVLAAEAESELVGLGERVGPAPRLAGIVGAVQSSATGTGLLAGGLREIFVDRIGTTRIWRRKASCDTSSSTPGC